jgi:hypothetical protein
MSGLGDVWRWRNLGGEEHSGKTNYIGGRGELLLSGLYCTVSVLARLE